MFIAKELAGKLKSELGLEKALEQAVRTSLSILTEGVLVAPTEGVVKVSTLENSNKTKCDLCDLVLPTPERLARHKKKAHGNVPEKKPDTSGSGVQEGGLW